MARTCRKVASGRDSVKTTVESSGVVMPSIVGDVPPLTASNPLMAPKKPAPGPCVFGSTARSIEYLTSEAATSRPLGTPCGMVLR